MNTPGTGRSAPIAHTSWLLLFCLGLVTANLSATPLQLVSRTADTLASPAGGSGDSEMAVISADGRWVLFESTAANLVVITNPAPVPGLLPPRQNVFLRDRVTGTTTLISLNQAKNGYGNGDSFPAAISTNGQFALFVSAANNLVAGDTNNFTDVFLRDLANNTNRLISVRTNGGPGNGNSRSATMTPDGRYIAFVSAATNFVANDTNGIPDVFVRDRIASTTTLVSVGARSPGSSPTLTGSSETPEITPDGRYVVFYSSATNLVPGVTNVGEIYVRDVIAGTTTMASTNARALLQSVVGTLNVTSSNHRISDDGRYVAFITATNPVANSFSRGVVMRHDLQTGLTQIVSTNAIVPPLPPEDLRMLDFTPDGRYIAFVGNILSISGGPAQCVYRWDANTETTDLVSQEFGGWVSQGTSCDWPTMDASGRFVAFISSGANLVTNIINGTPQLYLRDLQTGTTELVSKNASGRGYSVNTLTAPALSADGQIIVFDAADGELTSGDNNGATDVFARDRSTLSTELISARHSALSAQTFNGISGFSRTAVSADGRFIAFTSDGGLPTTANSNRFRNVLVRDLFLGTNYVISTTTNGVSGNGFSSSPSLSGDGSLVVFTSYATNLVAGDTNNYTDIFLWNRHTGVRSLVSVKTNSTASANGASQAATISTDGRYVTFISSAQNLTPTNTSGDNLFQRDLQTGVTRALTTGGIVSYAQTPDGSRVAFVGRILNDLTDRIYVWDTLTATRILTNAPFLPSQIGISANGQRLAFRAGSPTSIYAVNLISNTTNLVSGGALNLSLGISLSADGRYLPYVSTVAKANDANGVSDVWLRDLQTDTDIQVCRRYDSPNTPNGASDMPTISPDGRFVAYRSWATNAVVNDLNGVADLLLFDRLSNRTYSVSRSILGNFTANHSSALPFFSQDSRLLVFSSFASDLRAGDFNASGDVFALALPTTAITDTDGDGLDDLWEQLNFGNLTRNGTGDFDNDVASDLFEFQNLTNPTDANSSFRAELASGPTLRWPALPWLSYQIQFKDELTATGWQDLNAPYFLVGTNGVATDPLPAPEQRFYRVIANP